MQIHVKLTSEKDNCDTTIHLSLPTSDYFSVHEKFVKFIQSLAIKEHKSLYFYNCGDKKINVIKAIRTHLGSSLKDAKDLSERVNYEIFKSYDSALVEAFYSDLVREGAVVELR